MNRLRFKEYCERWCVQEAEQGVLQVGDLKMVLGKEVEPRTSTSCNHVGPRVLDAQRDIGGSTYLLNTIT